MVRARRTSDRQRRRRAVHPHAQGGLIWLRDWESADELRAAIATWLRHYLHHRPHQALNRQTPLEPRAERLATPIALAA